MEQLTDVGLSTGLICLGIYFVVLFFQYVARKIWAATSNKIVRGVIKWVGSMWLPLWPIAIGAVAVRFIPSIPLPKMITGIAPEPGVAWTIYGAFCGMICMAVVKGIKHYLEKKGINIAVPDLAEAGKVVETEGSEEEEPEEEPESPDSGKDSDREKSEKSEESEDEDEEDKEPKSGKSKKD